jgi:hypothetical protein
MLLTCGATAADDPPEDIRYIWTFELQILGSNGWAREDLASLLTEPSRIAPRTLARNSARLADRIATRAPGSRPEALSQRATAFASRSKPR